MLGLQLLQQIVVEGLLACAGEVVVSGVAQGVCRANLDAGPAETALIVIQSELGGGLPLFPFLADAFDDDAEARACLNTQIARHTERLVGIGYADQFDGSTKAVLHLDRFMRVLDSDVRLEEVLESDSQAGEQAAKSSEDFLNGVFHLQKVLLPADVRNHQIQAAHQGQGVG